MSHGTGQRVILDLIATPEAMASFHHQSHPDRGEPGPVAVPLDTAFGIVYNANDDRE